MRICPIISQPDFEKEFLIAVDASNTGIGAVLYQLRTQNDDHAPNNRFWVDFASRALHISERNYSVTKRELLGIVLALKRFHYYVWGRRFQFFTYHRSLSFLLSQKKLNPMMPNWLKTILSHDFTIQHRLSVLNVLSDAPSSHHRTPPVSRPSFRS